MTPWLRLVGDSFGTRLRLLGVCRDGASQQLTVGTAARIDGLFEIAAETTLIGSYTRNASRERKAADVWRLAAIGAALIAVAIGIWATVGRPATKPTGTCSPRKPSSA